LAGWYEEIICGGNGREGEREREAVVVDVLRIFRVEAARDVEEMEGREREREAAVVDVLRIFGVDAARDVENGRERERERLVEVLELMQLEIGELLPAGCGRSDNNVRMDSCSAEYSACYRR